MRFSVFNMWVQVQNSVVVDVISTEDLIAQHSQRLKVRKMRRHARDRHHYGSYILDGLNGLKNCTWRVKMVTCEGRGWLDEETED